MQNSAFLILLIVVSVLNSVSQIIMRWGGNLATSAQAPNAGWGTWLWHSRWWIAGLALGWFCGLGWAICLRKLPLALGLPVYSGLVYILSVLGGVWLLREKMGPLQMAGVLLIFLGIMLLMATSQSQGKI